MDYPNRSPERFTWEDLNMFWWGPDRVQGWLTAHDVLHAADGSWSANDQSNLSANELIHEIIDDALRDPDISLDDQVRLGFGLLDFFDDYAAAMYLRWEFVGVAPRFAGEIELVWRFCREVLEREIEATSVSYWLWVDWFEDQATSDNAFRQMVEGYESLPAGASADDPVFRRIYRVVRASGPVPWDTKSPVYNAAAEIPALIPAVRQAIEASERDYYGRIDERAAQRLISKLR